MRSCKSGVCPSSWPASAARQLRSGAGCDSQPQRKASPCLRKRSNQPSNLCVADKQAADSEGASKLVPAGTLVEAGQTRAQVGGVA